MSPSVTALAAWLGLERRTFEPDEIKQMIAAWCKAVEARGLRSLLKLHRAQVWRDRTNGDNT